MQHGEYRSGDGRATILRADARHLPLPDGSVDLVVTSPPYFGLRSYTDGGEHYEGQIGDEPTPHDYIAALLECTQEWARVLKPAGSIWVNLGDKYSTYDGPRNVPQNSEVGRRQSTASQESTRYTRNAPAAYGIPYKSLMALPARYEIGCIDQLGLTVRRDQIWSKANGMPESCTDRTRTSHEYWFHLVKAQRYYSAVDLLRKPSVPQNGMASTFKRPRPSHALVPGQTTTQHRPDRADAPAYHPLGALPGSVWEIASEPLVVPGHLGVDHYAAFPMEWPRRIITGWSPPGVCIECGEGRRPVLDRGPARGDFNGRGKDLRAGRTSNSTERNRIYAERVAAGIGPRIVGEACACPDTSAPTRPAVVLDPFGGTGTTSLVARALGRHGISVDRSADYCRLATWRTNDPAQLAKAMRVPAPPKVADGQDALDLFGDLGGDAA